MTSQFTAVRKHNIPLWRRWYSMTQRVEKKYRNYEHVTIEDSWNRDVVGPEQAFLNFWEDMGDDFEEHLELDRIDPHAEYSAYNCRWVTRTQQANNHRFHFTDRGRWLTWMRNHWGDTKKTKQRFHSRCARGWTPQEAAEIPPAYHNDLKRIRSGKKNTKPRTVWQKIASII